MAFWHRKQQIRALELKVAGNQKAEQYAWERYHELQAEKSQEQERYETFLEDLAKLYPDAKGLQKSGDNAWGGVFYDFEGVHSAATFAEHKANHKAYSAVSN